MIRSLAVCGARGLVVLLSLALGHADASAQSPLLSVNGTSATAGQPIDVASADFNQDGIADVAILLAQSGNVDLRIGNGNGGFVPYVVLAGTPAATCIAIDYVNADPIPDVFVGATTGLIQPFVSLAPGVWTAATAIAVGVSVRRMVTADFDQDGRPDLALASVTPTGGSVRVSMASPAGSYATTVLWTAANAINVPGQIAVADLDGDGWLDILVGRNGQGLFLHANDHIGGFSAPATLALTGAAFEDVRVGYVDGDPNPDIVVVLASSTFSPSAMLLYSGDGAGTFTPTGVGLYSGTPGGALKSVAVIDVDRDGSQDLVLGTGGANQFEVFLGAPAGLAPQQVVIPVGFATDRLLAVDADADLDHDVVAIDAAGSRFGIALTTATLARQGLPRIGTTFTLMFDVPADATLGFVLAAASSATPGTTLPDARVIPLVIEVAPGVVDPVFTISTTPGGLGVFSGFQGLLSNQGRATATVNVPNLPSIVGLSIAFAGVTLSPGASLGIATISNAQTVVLAN